MSDRLDDLAGEVDDALVSADELEADPGTASPTKVARAKKALEEAKGAVDEMEDAKE